MQGSDFLIKSKNEINCFFCENAGKEFVEYEPKNYEFANWKCRYRHFFVENTYYRKSIVLKCISHGMVKLQKLLKLEKMQDVSKLYHGSAMFSISHRCAEYVLQHEEIMRKCYKYAIAADEVFLQTLIMNSPYKNNIYHLEKRDGNVRYIDWEYREGNAPKTFTVKDVDMLLNLPKQYCFARKFSDRHIDAVEKLMEELAAR